MQIEIDANNRAMQGKGASRRLRRAGKVPGIVYGGEGQAQSIELDHNNLFHKLKLEAFHASILSLSLDGKKRAGSIKRCTDASLQAASLACGFSTC